MSTIYIPDQAKLRLLTLRLAGWDFWLHLYVIDTPLVAALTGDLMRAVECTAPGYAAIHVTAWVAPSILQFRAITTAPVVTFTRSSGDPQQQIYGVFATEGQLGDLLMVQRDDNAPLDFGVSTDQYQVQPFWSGEAQPPLDQA